MLQEKINVRVITQKQSNPEKPIYIVVKFNINETPLK